MATITGVQVKGNKWLTTLLWILAGVGALVLIGWLLRYFGIWKPAVVTTNGTSRVAGSNMYTNGVNTSAQTRQANGMVNTEVTPSEAATTDDGQPMTVGEIFNKIADSAKEKICGHEPEVISNEELVEA